MSPSNPEHREADVAREAKRRGRTLERLSNGRYMLTGARTPPRALREAVPDSGGMSLDEVEQVLVGATGWVLLAIQRAPFGRRVNAEQARTLAVAAEPLWHALEECGMVDDYGSMECARVLPAALEFIHDEVNRQRAEDSS